MSVEDRDEFRFRLIDFMAGLHDCHICNYALSQMNGMGKKRTFCDKYKKSIKYVRWYCFDRYLGFSPAEMREINRQYISKRCMLVIEGEAV